MATNKGLMLVTMEPFGIGEDEFNDWYDSEHLPERAALPGFEAALRYVCLEGWPRYLAVYDLSDLSALYSEDYKAVSGARFSPWTVRVTARVRGRYRHEAVQIHPGDGVSGAAGPIARLAVYRFRRVGDPAALTAALRARFEERAEVQALRVFRLEAGEEGCLALLEFRLPPADWRLDPADLGGAAVDLANLYAPYWHRV